MNSPDDLSMNIIRRALGWNYCPYRLPWFMEAPDLATLNLIGRREDRRVRAERGERAELLAATALWPIASALQAGKKVLGAPGRGVREIAGVGRFRQLADMLWLANRRNIGPRHYYRYRLWETERRQHVDRLMFIHWTGHLLATLSRGADRSPLSDKVAFHDLCTAQNLPCVPIIARFSGQSSPQWFAKGLPERDLFIKPVSSNKGQGAERWTRNHAGWNRQGQQLDAEQLVDHLSRIAQSDDYLVMECVRNHEALQHLTPGGLATLRVVTCKSPNAPAWELLSVFRMPVGDAEVDNMAAGGIAAPVSTNGLLGPALSKQVTDGVMDRHPTTGGPIAGSTIPMMHEAVELCCRAHETFPGMASIGWDVAITPDGPVLVEGNVNWCTELAQLPSGVPLGQTRLVEWAHRELDEGSKA